MKNWFGMESHPSDSLIHWSDISFLRRQLTTKSVVKIHSIREAWDLLHSTPELTAAFTLISDLLCEHALDEVAENSAGEDL